MAHTDKRKNEIFGKICEEYSKNELSITDCCKMHGLDSRVSFYRWIKLDESGQFKEIFEKAKEEKVSKYIENIGVLALTSLERKLKGWEWEEIHMEGIQGQNGKIEGQKIKKIKKFQIPDTAAVIFALCNVYPEDFKNRLHADLTTSGKEIKFIGMSIEPPDNGDSENKAKP